MVLVLEKEDKWVYFVYVQFHAVTTWSMNCYFVYVDNNQEWWPFSLGCKFTSFSWLQKHLPRFHFKTMWYHLCFPLPQPCETTQDLELLWHFINLWSLGRVWQLVRACKRTYMVDRTTLNWKVLILLLLSSWKVLEFGLGPWKVLDFSIRS